MSPFDVVLDRPHPAPAPPRQALTDRYRALVADDERDVVHALALLLGGHQFVVTPAASPAEALAAARQHAFDAAIVDLNFEKGRTGGEQGLDLVSSLVAHDPTLPIVVITAWNSEDLTFEALARGARDVVEKPWADARLVALLKTQVELGRAQRRVRELEGEVRQLRNGESVAPDGPAASTMRLLEVEGQLVRKAMERHQGNVSRAARTLGLSRSALYRRLERHKI
jgi:DNA-binding NtrC family response regulator